MFGFTLDGRCQLATFGSPLFPRSQNFRNHESDSGQGVDARMTFPPARTRSAMVGSADVQISRGTNAASSIYADVRIARARLRPDRSAAPNCSSRSSPNAKKEPPSPSGPSSRSAKRTRSREPVSGDAGNSHVPGSARLSPRPTRGRARVNGPEHETLIGAGRPLARRSLTSSCGRSPECARWGTIEPGLGLLRMVI